MSSSLTGHCAQASDPMPLPLPQATAGSPHYMAPELFHPGAVYSFASDLWALGVVLHECFAGAQPFRRELFADLQRDIESAAAPPLKGGIQPALDRAPAWAALASLLPSPGLRSEAVCESDRHDLWPLLKQWWCAMHRCQSGVSGPCQPAAGQEPGEPHGLGAAASKQRLPATPFAICIEKHSCCGLFLLFLLSCTLDGIRSTDPALPRLLAYRVHGRIPTPIPAGSPFWRLAAAKGVDPTPPKLRLPRETAFEAYVERAGLLQGGRGAADKVRSCMGWQ